MSKKCAAQHFGYWSIEPVWFGQAVSAVQAGTWEVHANHEDSPESGGEMALTPDGIGIIPIMGQITKGDSSFGGVSSVRTRQTIRAAVADPDVRGLMLHIDSPGGTVDGTPELAAEVRRAAQAKPVRAHVDDLGASAAYWIASQTSHITANKTGRIGSIGTVAVIEDTSGMAEAAGIKVHVISTGAHKGAGTPGVPVTDEQLDHIQSLVNEMNSHFLSAVRSGRNMTAEQLDPLADGRVFMANKAMSSGLIDGVMFFEDALSAFSKSLEPVKRQMAARRLALGR